MFKKLVCKSTIVMLLIGSLVILNTTVSAEILGEANLTGYTYMGGGSANTSTPDGPDSQKDYVSAQPIDYYFGVANFWGYGWTKFDVGTETVSSAYLVLDLLGVGNMGASDASESNPGILDIYSPGTTDVADLGVDEGLRTSLHDSLSGTTPFVNDFTMTANGTYFIDITSIYNGWVDGTIANNGLILSTNVDNSGPRFASFGNADGNAPYISSVPVPGAFLLMGFGLVGLIGFTRRDR